MVAEAKQELNMAQAWQIIVNRKALYDGAALVAKAAAKNGRASLPVTGNTLLHLIGGATPAVRLTATDLDIALTTVVPCSTSNTDGWITVPAKELAAVVKSMPGIEVALTAEYAEQGRCWLTVTSGAASATLDGIDADEFPLAPQAPSDAPAFSLPADLMRRIGTHVALTAATDDLRMTFVAVNVQLKDGTLTAAATDGYQLATLVGEHDGAYDGALNIPARSLSVFASLLPKDAGAVQIVATQAQAWLTADHCTMVTRLVEGRYINYQQIIPAPSKATTVVTVSAAALLNAVKATRSRETPIIRFAVDDGSLTVSDAAATRRTLIVAETTGAPLTTLVSAVYMQAFLATLPKAAQIVMRLSNPQHIIAFEVAGDDAYGYYCMPMSAPR